MLKSLIKIRFMAMFSSMFRNSKKGKSYGIGMKIFMGIVFAYILGVMGMLFGSIFYMMCEPFDALGLNWLYFALAGMFSFAICFVGSIFMTQSQLYEAKDNELLLAMPVPPSYILLSRMIALLLMNYLYELVVMIPAGIVYVMFLPVTAMGVIAFLVSVVLLPFLVMTFSCIFGWLVALISSRMRRKNLIVTIISVVLFCGYMAVCTQLYSYMEALVENGVQIGEAVQKSIFPAYHLGKAIADSSVGSLLLFVLCAVVPFVIVYVVLSKNFIHIATAKRGTVRIEYKEKQLKVSSGVKALTMKDLSRLGGNPMYILNACTGSILLLLAIGAAIWKYDDVASIIEMGKGYMGDEVNEILWALAASLFGACSIMNIVSAPSISLEGKNLWILKTLPIPSGKILISKVWAHVIACVPAALLGTIVCLFILPFSLNGFLMTLILPLLMNVWQAFFGVIVNLFFPRFDWVSETACVKQGISVMIAMFGGMAIVAIPILLYMFVIKGALDLVIYVWIWAAVFAVLCIGMWRYLMTAGSRRFDRL